MAAPHREDRYGELFKKEKIESMESCISLIAPLVVLSGGWAWHYMTPKGHAEYKHAHDHKDIDLFVRPENKAELIYSLNSLGFTKEKTKYDTSDFQRYTIYDDVNNFKIILDIFTGNPPSVKIDNEISVVQPNHLLTYYDSGKHQSTQCFSLQIAKELLNKNEDPVLHFQMADYERFISQNKKLKVK